MNRIQNALLRVAACVFGLLLVKEAGHGIDTFLMCIPVFFLWSEEISLPSRGDMTFREMNFRVFEGKSIPHVLFQPRIEPWYDWHRQFNCLPARYRDRGLLDVFDDLKVSMRYVNYYTGMPDPIKVTMGKKIKIREDFRENTAVRVIETPEGELVENLAKTPDNTWRTIGAPVRTASDLKALKSFYQSITISFSRENFEQGSKFMGDRGVPQFWGPPSPYKHLCYQWMKLENFIYALNDSQKIVEDVMKAIDDACNGFYEELLSYGRVKIVNFGENIHAQLLSPAYLEKYLLPFYHKRSGSLRKAGIYTHIHIDGFFKPLLRYLKDLPFDGLEALTPLPQGDVSIEEIHENIGGKVLLDGIPAVLFLPTYSREELQECTEKLVRLFHPRLILGISDELPEGSGEEGIERVRMISDYCRETLS